MIRNSIGLVLPIFMSTLLLSGCERETPRPIPPAPTTAREVPNEPAAAKVSGESTTDDTPALSTEATPPAATTETPSIPPVPPKANETAKVSPPLDSKIATFAGLTAPKPATWIWRPPQRQFSVAEYGVPGRDGSDQARIDVFTAGGTVDANIARWKMQFRNADGSPVEPTVSTLEADGMAITLVEFAGEYKGMGMISFTPGQLFLCAIVQAPAEQIFIRFVGPAGTVEPNREAYMDMIRNLKKVEAEK